MKYMVTLHGKNYEVEVEQGEAILVAVTDAVQPAPAPGIPAVAPPSAAVPPREAPAPAAPVAVPAGGKPVHSPLPGTLVDIKVAVGAAVKKGDVLMVIEAMKMESEIVAPDNGVVSTIPYAKGATVLTGDLLMVLA